MKYEVGQKVIGIDCEEYNIIGSRGAIGTIYEVTKHVVKVDWGKLGSTTLGVKIADKVLRNVK